MLDLISRTARAALRLLLVLLGLAFTAALLVAGLATAGVWVLWNLLRGRKPRIEAMRVFRMQRDAMWAAGRTRQTARAEVIDIDARVVDDAREHLVRR